MSKFNPLKHGFDEFYGILYSNDMWPKHPEQGSVFNFPDIELYENDKPIKVLNDQTFLTEALTDKAIDFIKRNKGNPFSILAASPTACSFICI